jgi:hypothetical protein
MCPSLLVGRAVCFAVLSSATSVWVGVSAARPRWVTQVRYFGEVPTGKCQLCATTPKTISRASVMRLYPRKSRHGQCLNKQPSVGLVVLRCSAGLPVRPCRTIIRKHNPKPRYTSPLAPRLPLFILCPRITPLACFRTSAYFHVATAPPVAPRRPPWRLTCRQREPQGVSAVLSDGVERVHHIAQRLGHLATLLVADLQRRGGVDTEARRPLRCVAWYGVAWSVNCRSSEDGPVRPVSTISQTHRRLRTRTALPPPTLPRMAVQRQTSAGPHAGALGPSKRPPSALVLLLCCPRSMSVRGSVSAAARLRQVTAR